MSRRQAAGHSVRITRETFARLLSAAVEDRTTEAQIAEDAIARHLDERETRKRHAAFVRANREAEARGEPTITRAEFDKGRR